MIKLLLDFPWELESVLLSYSEGYAVLHGFEQLCEAEHLQRVRFVSEEEYSRLMDEPLRRAGLNVVRPVLQVLSHYLRGSFGTIRATPAAGPDDLSDNWKLALREEMVDLDDWRTPQIIACEDRRDDWKASITGAIDRTEVKISCEDRDEPVNRVIAFLETYRAHHYARSDRDPWDLARTRTPHEERPCSLPKPPRLTDVPLQDLKSEVKKARDDGWFLEGRYYFIPPDDWDPDDWIAESAKRTWRDNGSFRDATTVDNHHGPVDFEGRVWSWDLQERHWDVQLGPGRYWSISHIGRLLKKNE